MEIKIYIDEAWRGPLAWPIYIWVVIPLSKINLEEFKDSKLLNETKREILFEKIAELENNWFLVYWFWYSDNTEIDKYWISKAINISICRWLILAIKKLNKILYETSKKNNDWYWVFHTLEINKTLLKKNISYNHLKSVFSILNNIVKIKSIIIDWKNDFWINKDLWIKTITIVDWDDKVKEISAASIIAKVLRDREMKKYWKKYPKYWFDQHKWYWTKLHRQKITEHWTCKIHRISFLSNILNINEQKEKEWIPKNFNLWKNDFKNFEKERPTLLLHVCCWPDLTRPLKKLKKFFKLYLFWYNPNIHPYTEHKKRYEQYTKTVWLEKWDYEIIEDSYDPKIFFESMYFYRALTKIPSDNYWEFMEIASKMNESSPRCFPCYYNRLKITFEMAEKLGIDYFSTTLFISPKKKFEKLTEYWINISKFSKTNFLYFDFKKNDWYKKSCRITKEYWLYRQNYCGCIWSKNNLEDKNNLWK